MTLLNRVNTQSSSTQQKPARKFSGQAFSNKKSQQSSPFSRSNRSSPFGSRSSKQQLANVIIPMESTLVRFSLEGLGDPFYRLLGQQMNPDFGNVNSLAEALQKGGESVKDLTRLLDDAWHGYNLDGAMLVFSEDREVLNALLNPTPMPNPPKDDKKKEDDEEDEEDDPLSWMKTVNYEMTRLRAIDLTLTLNVLSRARSQVIVAHAPAVFGVEYLTRSLVTDDPRLVSLAKATGCLPDN